MKQGYFVVLGLGLIVAISLSFKALERNQQLEAPLSTPPKKISGLAGDVISPLTFDNPYAHVPAQCYIETGNGRQNACMYCHTNGLYKAGFGNNNPQAGAVPLVNFQIDYGFDPLSTTAPYATINRWENTLYPQKLAQYVADLGIDSNAWQMDDYIKTDNWQAAFNQRYGSPLDWDSGFDTPFRFLPGLDPSDLPADNDGFVRSEKLENGFFQDSTGQHVTGWRAINFMPYGIFTPISGSVSGIFIRLPKNFMQNDAAEFDLEVYSDNLELLYRAITDNLTDQDPSHYLGQASNIKVELGAYPKGTEFAHPLHYVDVDADGTNSHFPGTRANRVKEVRWMYKFEDYNPNDVRPGDEGDDGFFGNEQYAWVDNAAGWMLSGFIEDQQGQLRPQSREELAQCIGCHSGFTANTVRPSFTSGTGNTVDSTWSLPRKFAGNLGWKEMDYMGFGKQGEAFISTTPEPLNREMQKGEFGIMLEYVVGASLYGDMPQSYEDEFKQIISQSNGYSDDWLEIDQESAEGFDQTTKTRQTLLREFVAKGDYLNDDNTIKPFLLYPSKTEALETAKRYRQVVVTQRYQYGKDVFAATPITYFHHRLPGQEELKIDGTPYQFGELITERQVELENPTRFDYRAGIGITLVDEALSFEDGGTYNPDYIPYIQARD
jgi:hypothetical protein